LPELLPHDNHPVVLERREKSDREFGGFATTLCWSASAATIVVRAEV
jgi:hypothetical protein